MDDLRMELGSVDHHLTVLHRGPRGVLALCYRFETRGQLEHPVAVRHPYVALVGDSAEQVETVRYLEGRGSELAHPGPLYDPSQELRRELHPAAYAEERHAKLEYPSVHGRGIIVPDARGTSRQY